MQTAIITSANRINGWPIPFLDSVRRVQKSVANEIFSATSLALLQTRLAGVIADYQAQGSLDSSVNMTSSGPTAAVYDGTGAQITPADTSVYYTIAGHTNQTPFTVKALAT